MNKENCALKLVDEITHGYINTFPLTTPNSRVIHTVLQNCQSYGTVFPVWRHKRAMSFLNAIKTSNAELEFLSSVIFRFMRLIRKHDTAKLPHFFTHPCPVIVLCIDFKRCNY